FFTRVETNGHCVGCHALSHDGSKMALTYDGLGCDDAAQCGTSGSGAVLDVATRASAVPPQTYKWNFATFTPDGKRVLTVYQGQLSLRDATSGDLNVTVPNAGVATQPDFSPKGDQFVYVQQPGTMFDWSFTSGNLYTVSYDPSSLSFGEPHPLVTGGGNNYYPSYSPDGQWILFNRTSDNSNAYDSG